MFEDMLESLINSVQNEAPCVPKFSDILTSEGKFIYEFVINREVFLLEKSYQN
jgi:hypothetical protein